MQQWEYTTLLRKRLWDKKREGFEFGNKQGYLNASAWEYYADGQKVTGSLKQLLESYGSQGWELVAVSARSSRLGGDASMMSFDYSGFTDEEEWVFKRPKE
jgi:hypothetical protein